ncbi:type II toxin-antitoxin system VapC family toxin [Leucobacter insecticola]|uniref:Type II toxin-antitoxin system VapC family toxin n=1 Tax=Leucobacter insecticola TaxID=2714934 RepID=A0A6G8FJ33_9MICO|nr:type II toxin-antitoxin system VapC family toxin [Leucobacter insecticola]QIM16348.1 type II toxin-antitoxin system VapC family toxin [Leucobacter insecticola]
MILLDTNALIWSYLDAPQLGECARERIRLADRVFYSSISVSEIVIKHMLGKITLPGGQRFPTVFDEMGLTELRFSGAHASELLHRPRLSRHDPFDRFLIGQAEAEGMQFLTADAALLKLGETWIIDARE